VGFVGPLLVLQGRHAEAQVATVTYSKACPALKAGSLALCGRCVSDDLCPSIDGAQYRCDQFYKKCVAPTWSSSEVAENCPETRSNPATWGAMCKQACLDQSSPFGCAGRCMNEDFPCRWVPGCSGEDDWLPFSLPQISSACLRSCVDHDLMVSVLWNVDDCAKAQKAFGGCATNSIWQFCPVTCATSECPDRCNRDEEVDESGLKCWQHVERDGVSCTDAMKKGMDCHCKCAGTYLMVSGTPFRKGGGAFTWRDQVEKKGLDMQMSVSAGETFSVSLTGETMSDMQGIMNPARLKIVPKGQPCIHADNAQGVAGLVCERPAGSDVLTMTVCDTAPAVATPWLHRWTGLSISACGDFDICHCNKGCEVRDNWNLAGGVSSTPASLSGDMDKAPPGCAAFFPTLAPVATVDGEDMMRISAVKVALSIAEGLLPLYGLASVELLSAVQLALAEYLGTFSKLLDKTVPEPSDVRIDVVARRRLRSSAEVVAASEVAGVAPRGLQGACADDDAKFAEEVLALGMSLSTCGQGLTAAGSADMLCNDPTLEKAAKKCAATCGACSGGGVGATATTPPAPGSGGSTGSAGGGSSVPEASGSTTAAPTTTTPWPGGPKAFKLRVEVVTKTYLSAETVLARLEQLRTDATPLIQILHKKLGEAGFSSSALPETLSVYVVEGPELGSASSVDGSGGGGSGSDTDVSFLTPAMLAILCGSLGGFCCLMVGGCCLWHRATNRYEVKVAAEPSKPSYEETVNRSDGGYRYKVDRKEVPGAPLQAHKQQKPRRRGCCARLLARCSGCFCSLFEPKLRRPDLPARSSRGSGGALMIGATVQLIGLQAMPHFNGLVGTVVSGPNEAGRYTVELSVWEDDRTREHQTKAFKADNLLVIDPDSSKNPSFGGGAVAGAAAGVETGSSYRNSRR